MTKIGLEVHVQLNCKSKVFCSCPTQGSEEPNSRTCPTCLGLPGSKPTINKETLNQGIKVALALNCKIAPETFFSRKSYFYPDLTKNYQITQYETPFAINGKLENIRIRRIHLEEDPGALIHKKSFCLIDYNRSGIPLIEIVTEPDFKSPNEVRLFLKKLTTILEYLNVYTRKSEATMKADANISTTGERVEIKNITGLKEIERALLHEEVKQKEDPAKKQETRGWDANKGKTYLLRTKESEDDYGYIYEPDLVKIEVSKDLISKLKSEIPELDKEKTLRFKKQYKLQNEDAEVIASEIKLANLFEEIAEKVSPKLAAKWLRRDLQKVLSLNKKTLSEIKLDSQHMTELLTLLEQNKITDNTAKRILQKLIQKPFPPLNYIKKQNLLIISSESNLQKICKDIIKNNPQPVQDFKSGKTEAIHYLTGIIMKESKGTANPYIIKKILIKLLRKTD